MALNIILSHPMAKNKTADAINGRLLILDRGVSPTPDRYAVWKQQETGLFFDGEHFQHLSDALANFADRLKIEEHIIENSNHKWADTF